MNFTLCLSVSGYDDGWVFSKSGSYQQRQAETCLPWTRSRGAAASPRQNCRLPFRQRSIVGSRCPSAAALLVGCGRAEQNAQNGSNLWMFGPVLYVAEGWVS